MPTSTQNLNIDLRRYAVINMFHDIMDNTLLIFRRNVYRKEFLCKVISHINHPLHEIAKLAVNLTYREP